MPIIDKIEKDPQGFKFFQLVRLLKHFMEHDEAFKEKFERYPYRFKSNLLTSFPASEIHDLSRSEEAIEAKEPYEIITSFMGLVGVKGVLPTSYTERLYQDRFANKSDAATAFIDLFQHRLIELFYQSWSKYQMWHGLESRDDFYPSIIRALGGLTDGHDRAMQLQNEHMQNQLRYSIYRSQDKAGLGHTINAGIPQKIDITRPTDPMMPLLGVLRHRPASASSLKSLLSSALGFDVTVFENQKSWRLIPDRYQTRLNRVNQELSSSAVIGRRYLDIQNRVHVTIGPMNYEDYRDFYPGNLFHTRSINLIRLLFNKEMHFVLQPVLNKDETPTCILCQDVLLTRRIGFDAWIGKKTKQNKHHQRLKLLL